MKKKVVMLMFLTIVARSMGFLRDIVLSYYYGVSRITDAYLISITIPTVIFAFIGVSISSSYIPIYTEIEQREGRGKALDFSNKLINTSLIFSTLFIIITLFFPENVIKVFASGFDGATLSLAVSFTRIMIFSVIFSMLIYIFTAYLNVNNSFNAPAIMGIPLNIIIIFSIAVSFKHGYIFLPLGHLLAMGIQLLFISFFAYKNGYKYTLGIDLKNKYLIKMLKLSFPVIMGTSVNEINVLVDRTLASHITVGGISALDYANKLVLLIQSVFVQSITTVLFPKMTKMAALKNMKGFRKSISNALIGILILIAPCLILFITFHNQIIDFLFGRGAFNVDAINMTSKILFYYSFGMIGVSIREVFSRAFYAMQDTKTPMINASIGLMINIGLNLFLSKYMGLNGLALATSLSAIITSILLYYQLNNKIGSILTKEVLLSLVKILGISIGMGVIMILFYNLIISKIPPTIVFLLSSCLGVVFYLITVMNAKIDEVDLIISSFKKRTSD